MRLRSYEVFWHYQKKIGEHMEDIVGSMSIFASTSEIAKTVFLQHFRQDSLQIREILNSEC